jgi:prepilin-type N-terminal cleavage/methylation domain-containing protein
MPACAGLTLTLKSTPDKSYNPPMIHGYWILARGLLRVRAMKSRHRSTSRGFSLVELLIVCAVIGLVAAIAIPNLINAIERGRQARTIGDLRGLSTGIAMYQQDFAKFPVVADWVGAAVLEDSLQAYMGVFNELDGWRKPFMYLSDGNNYTLASYGMNGTADLPWTLGATHFFDDDVVVNNGVIIQWPAGVQQ